MTEAAKHTPTIDDIARRMFNDAHRGMANCYDWDTSGLDDEHPGTRDRYYGYAQSALNAFEEQERLVETLTKALDRIANAKHLPMASVRGIARTALQRIEDVPTDDLHRRTIIDLIPKVYDESRIKAARTALAQARKG